MTQALTTSLVTDPKDLEVVFHLRYQVYYLERKYKDSPENIMHDEFDEYSLNFLTRNGKGTPIATARLVLYSPLGFPLEKGYDMSESWVGIDRTHVAEFSRFALSKNIREAEGEAAATPDSKKFGHSEVALHLILALLKESRKRGITHWCAAIERSLWLALRHGGMGLRQIGPPKDYHGIRIPCLASLEELLDNRPFPPSAEYAAFFADVLQHNKDTL